MLHDWSPWADTGQTTPRWHNDQHRDKGHDPVDYLVEISRTCRRCGKAQTKNRRELEV